MTDKLIMTTEDRDYFLKCIKTLCTGSHSDSTRTAQTLQDMLQSLPMVSGEPVAWRRYEKAFNCHNITTDPKASADRSFEPLFTSPQASIAPPSEPSAWLITTELQDGTKRTYAATGKYKHVRDACDFGEPIPLYTSPQTPMLVDSQPCNEDLATDIEAIDAVHRGDPCYEHDAYYMRAAAAKLVRKGYPLFASPQPLTELSGDDVADDVVDAVEAVVIACPEHWDVVSPKELIAAAYNAVIKNRSEAR